MHQNIRSQVLFRDICQKAWKDAPSAFDIYIKNVKILIKFAQYIKMKTLAELGRAVAEGRKKRGLLQGQVARQSGLTQESLSRFENGQLSEFGSRKLLAVLAVLGLEMNFTEVGMSGTLDELRRERGGA